MRLRIALAAALLGSLASTALAQDPTQPPPPRLPDTVAPPPVDSGAPAVPGAEPADVNFWNSVKDSNNPADIRTYLSAFPNGFFAPLARLRLHVLEASQNPAPPAPPPLPPVIPVAPPIPPQPPVPPPPQFTPAQLDSPAFVSEMQDRLYNLFYEVPAINGVLDAPTKEAISRFQRNINAPVTGVITSDQFVILRNAVPDKTWGAIAYTARNLWGTSWNFATRRDAENDAMRRCRSIGGKNDCKLFTVAGKFCIAMAHHRTQVGRTIHDGVNLSRNADIEVAKREALNACAQRPNSRGRCRITTTVCADGHHKT